MLKLIDPKARYIWQHPADADVRFEYRPLAGPTFTTDLGKIYLNRCITAAWNVDIPGIGPVEHWTIEAGPEVPWSDVLPADVANALFVAVSMASRLTPEEERDLPSQSGSGSSAASSTAKDAAEANGSASDGETIPPKAGNGSKRRAAAGRR